jgi:branched-chain amino acid transport system permease protein
MEVLISALVLGSVYGLVAIGISFTWASIGMLNLAQGFIFTAGGYAAYLFAQFAQAQGIQGPALSVGLILSGMLGSALVGFLVGGLAFAPLQDRPNF